MTDLQALEATVADTLRRATARTKTAPRAVPRTSVALEPVVEGDQIGRLHAAIRRQRALCDEVKHSLDDAQAERRRVEEAVRSCERRCEVARQELEIIEKSVELMRARRDRLEHFTDEQRQKLRALSAGNRELTSTMLMAQQTLERISSRLRGPG